MLRVRLLGQFDIQLNRTSVDLPSRPAQSLLAFLMLQPHISHRREKLAGMLWPDSDEENARSNLRAALWRIRKAIGDDVLLADRMSVSFNLAISCWLDVAELEAAVSPSASTSDLMRAVLLFEGDLLPGFYDDWVLLERTRIRSVFERAIFMLLERLAEDLRWQDVLDMAERWIALGEVPEPAYRFLMRAHARLGDTSGVVAIYRRCEQKLARELGVEPAPETTALFERLAAVQPFRSDQRPDNSFFNNLPAETTPFFGRENELREIVDLLADPACRLLTLVGPGGIGKTRLALEAARQLLGRFENGVCYLSLVSLETPDLLVSSLASALEVPLHTGADPAELLHQVLRHQTLLIVLDNCEDRLPDSTLISDILSAASGVKILTTARSRLGLVEEYVLDVQGLPVTEGDHPSGAVALFIERARRMHAGFDGDLATIARICQQVGGMPLGIELAAAWTRLLSLAEIEHEMGTSLDFLVAPPSSNFPERHRDLRAVFTHTWKRLSEDERSVLQRCAVFSGRFTRRTAEQTTGASLPVLLELVDRALIERCSDNRFNLHDVIRQFALEQLIQDTDEYDLARGTLVGYYSTYLSDLAEDLRSSHICAALDTIEEDLANVRTAFLAAADLGQLDALQPMIVPLWLYYAARGPANEAREIFGRALAHLDNSVSPLVWQLRAAWLDFSSEQSPDVTAQSILKAVADSQAHAELGIFASVLAFAASGPNLGNDFDTHNGLERALNLARQSGDGWQIGATQFMLGHKQLYGLDQIDEARQHLSECISILEVMGEQFWLARSLTTLGDIALRSGNYDSARRLIERSLQLAETMRDPGMIAWNQIMLGRVLAATGHYAEAQRLYDEHLTQFRQIGFPYMRASALFAAGHLAALIGNYEEARRQLDISLKEAPNPDRPDRQIAYHMYRGMLASVNGAFEEAVRLFELALNLSEQTGHSVATITTRIFLGDTNRQQGAYGDALRYYQDAIKRSLEVGLLPEVLKALLGIAHVMAARGEPHTAVQMAAIAQRHPALSHADQAVAARLLSQLQSQIAADEFRNDLQDATDLTLDQILTDLLVA